MSMAATQKPLTGWHVLAMLVAFFGVIIGVNLTMAWFANSTWSGLVVANGYVASQSFDKDLAKARAQEALGWKVEFTASENRIRLTFEDKAGQKIDSLAERIQRGMPLWHPEDSTDSPTGVLVGASDD